MSECDCKVYTEWRKDIMECANNNIKMRIPYPPPCSQNTSSGQVTG